MGERNKSPRWNSWDSAVEKVWTVIRGNQDTVHREIWGLQDTLETKDRKEGKLALRNKAKEETHLEIYRGLREEIQEERKRTCTAERITRKR